jgi:glycosyltransferase involved in cell wall biosynthesis
MVVDSRKWTVLDWMMLRHVDGYIAANDELRDRARRLLSLPVERCVRISNGIKVAETHEPWPGQPTVIQVANLRWPKGHDTAVRAAALVKVKKPDLRWIMVGQIPDPPTKYTQEVYRLIESLGLDGSVVLAGERIDVQPFLGDANVGVLTSDVDAMPSAVLEYMAARLPVVITNVGEMPTHLLAANAGYVIEPRDPEAMAKAVIQLLEAPDEAARMGERGRSYVQKHFSIEACVGQVAEFYGRVREMCKGGDRR